MPTYEFQNELGDTFSKFMSISSKEEYLKTNPTIRQVHLTPSKIVGGVTVKDKTDDGWKEVLSKIAEAHPNSALADKVGGRNTTTSKVNDLAKKHGLRKSGLYDMKEL